MYRRLGILLLGMVAILILAYKVQTTSTSYIAYSMLALVILSLVYTLCVHFHVTYVQKLSSKTVTRGETVILEVGFYNDSKLYYPHMEVIFYGEADFLESQDLPRHISLEKKTHKVYEITVPCKRRGYYEIGIKRIKIRDFFNMWGLSLKVISPVMITVLPRLIELQQFPLEVTQKEQGIGSKRMYKESVGDMSEIRHYQDGDKMKSIHWKLFAKQQQLWTRVFEDEGKESVTIILNTNQQIDKVMIDQVYLQDMMIESALAVIYYGIKRDIAVDVYYDESGKLKHQQANKEKEFHDIYQTLSHLKFNGSYTVTDYAHQLIHRSVNHGKVIWVTDQLSYEIYECIGENSQEIIIVGKEVENEEMAQVCKALLKKGVACFISDDKMGLKPLEGKIKEV